ncbi:MULTISPECIES: hypothetical protein [unclassified Carboxylicivirga]|uniref:hypothetical protein n=1 Tax=Carboxylicivirga TaxID=1628153 RepID=UPI003D336282
MKTFNVFVPDDKMHFFGELLDGLNIKWEAKAMESRKIKSTELPEPPPKAYEVNEEVRKKAAKVREDSLKDVISRLDKMRRGRS